MREERGQATVELALLVSLLLMPLVFGMIEMGYLFSSHLTISAAAREGARMAGNLANGGGTVGCGTGQSPNWTTVDPQIIASVERSLTGSGSEITLSNVSSIKIYKADAAGLPVSGAVNTWTYSNGAGPVVDGDPLEFIEASAQWTACNRNNVIPFDTIGVAVSYTYKAMSPFRFFMPTFISYPVSDHTAMPLNATK